MKHTMLILTLLGGFIAAAQAQTAASNPAPKLKYDQACSKTTAQAACDKAVTASIQRVRNKKAGDKQLTCTPGKVTDQEALQVVKGYVHQNPQYLHLELDTLVVAALQIFPCK
jgi:hypothetical protein